MAEALTRIDANPFDRFLCFVHQELDNSNIWPILVSLGAWMGSVVLAMAFFQYILFLSVIGMVLVVGIPALWFYGYHWGDNMLVYRGYHSYRESDWYPRYRATYIYHRLNNDNKKLAEPVVRKIYELAVQTDSTGEKLYEKEVKERIEALVTLFDEQVATERVLAESKAKLERSQKNVVDDDVQRVLDYTNAMSEVREDFLQKQLTASD